MVDTVNEICLKKISLKVKYINKDLANFIRCQLVVHDCLNGTTRCIDIDYLIQKD